ncbi:hypothetical protein EW026_g417 [Hermanssonia centrifuga]|uniref:Uncharacterized protein n=1 Tax=Hermanssonia centrifuga TaxID=98765 RepID=A0A4S4KUR8_9APHY|nr:hypothetical protein EW026_g417 [Hermanssonia centrifuga]
MHQLVNHKDIERTDLSSLVHIFTGAAYMPPALEAKFKKLIKTKYPMFEGYGMSEMTLSVARKSWPEYFGKPKPGCAGVLAPGVEARIVRADGSEADVDEPGEIWVRGPNMALGYYNNEKATKEAFVDGWLRTGDHLKADKDGLLYFVDRVKDTLKVSGVQVSPTEIEDALMAHPNKLVEDVCVAGVSGGRTSDEKNPRAWVVLTEEGKRRGPETTLKMLDEWTKKTLSQYKWLRGGYEVVDAIPKNPTGKVLRRVLQDRYEQAKASKTKL